MAAYGIGDEVLSGWTITRFIDEGGFGRVYEVQKAGHGVAACSALKVVSIPPSASIVKTALSEGQDEASVRAYFGSLADEFASEVAFTSSLAHPGIVSYQDHAILPHEDGMGWDVLLRMELLTPLTERMAQGPLSTAEVVDLGVQMADVLAFCHAKGIIHRDVKPGNIFIDSMGRYKLGDFGVARTAEHTMGALSRKGTEDYMAPEAFRGEEYGASVDVYALGIVLYQLLNGNRLPFLPPAPAPVSIQDREQARVKRLTGERLPQLANVDANLYGVIAAACLPDATMRPSAADLRDALAGFAVPVSAVGATSGDATPASWDTGDTASFAAPATGEQTRGIWDAANEAAAEEERRRREEQERLERERLERERLERERLEQEQRAAREREERARLEQEQRAAREREERERLERERLVQEQRAAQERRQGAGTPDKTRLALIVASVVVGLVGGGTVLYWAYNRLVSGNFLADYVVAPLLVAVVIGFFAYPTLKAVRWLAMPQEGEPPRWMPAVALCAGLLAAVWFIANYDPNINLGIANVFLGATIATAAVSTCLDAVWGFSHARGTARRVYPNWIFVISVVALVVFALGTIAGIVTVS